MKVLRFLLFPFAVIYHLITAIRNVFFNYGILKSTSFKTPVIVVGNLNVGGTGKTPQIEYLIRLLKDSYKIAVLSRGYKRKTTGFLIVDSNATATDVGDEPLQFFKKFKDVIVAVDADRTNGIKQLLKNEVVPEVVLLDDAFQHRKVKAGFYILLTKYNDLFSDDFLLPTGNLRESRKGAKRADIIIVTKCPKELSEEEKQSIQEKLKATSNQKIFFTSIIYNDYLKGSVKINMDDLKKKEVVLVTGIANPMPLLQYLKTKKISFTHLKYPDHHNFSIQEIEKINSVFDEILSKEKIILTTEKDYVRLHDNLENLSYIDIANAFLGDEKLFISKIEGFIKR